jgi:hypothetical protein
MNDVGTVQKASVVFNNAQISELIQAAEYARDVLSVIPAFGDSIGNQTNKPQLGIAHNKLSEALRPLNS